MTEIIDLPDYREQSEAVKARFNRLHARPVKLEVQNISKSFTTSKGQVDVLKDVSFTVHRREFISVIGPSGCGKSNLIRMLAGLD